MNRPPLFNDGRRTHVLIEFVDIPDHTRSAGWICSPVGYKDGDPIGHGRTMREAFNVLLNRIEEDAAESKMRQFGHLDGEIIEAEVES